MPGKFALKQTSAGKFMFNLKAGNGQIILTSESYASKSGAMGGIESVRTNAGMDERYDRRTSTSGKPYFVLLAANKEPIGRSEMYSSASAMENGIKSVKENAPTAKVEEEA
ncbi:MAG: YegP family protein [Gemmatimonadota bacterium]|nr:YegP family protein [Gemmatimonadota bacterium]